VRSRHSDLGRTRHLPRLATISRVRRCVDRDVSRVRVSART